MSQSLAINSINSTNTINNISSIGTVDPVEYVFKAKDPMSALTHFIGFVFAVLLTPVLLIHASNFSPTSAEMISLGIFMISMALLYGASASYHTFKVEGEAAMRLKRLDHMMIFVLIAGSYTPICTIVLKEDGVVLLSVVWGIAILGMLFKLLWVTCPKWISSVMYIAMGWVVIFAMPTLLRVMDTTCFMWLLIGGIIYTIGGVIYALKLVRFNNRDSLWGSHEIFHLFVLGGSLCHFICIYNLF